MSSSTDCDKAIACAARLSGRRKTGLMVFRYRSHCSPRARAHFLDQRRISKKYHVAPVNLDS
eukprot:2088354-Rhodomonas_salina.2